MLNHLQGEVWKRVWIFWGQVWKRVWEMAYFGLKLGLDLEIRAAHPHQKCRRVPHPHWGLGTRQRKGDRARWGIGSILSPQWQKAKSKGICRLMKFPAFIYWFSITTVPREDQFLLHHANCRHQERSVIQGYWKGVQ